jgi:hypothetical protein
MATKEYMELIRKKYGYATYEKFLESRNRNTKKSNDRLKEKVINHYGGSCICCGEANIKFLTLSHPNFDGAKHKKELYELGYGLSGYSLYRFLYKNNYQTSYEIQIECYNCNCGSRSNGGVCPHKKQLKEIMQIG